MVLQRDKPNVFWGWTTPGESVTVSVGDKRASGKAGADGRWIVRLDPPKVGGPYRIDVYTKSRVAVRAASVPPDVKVMAPRQMAILEDVLVGDVWLCGGQSNMEFGLTQALGGLEEVGKADRPTMRLFMAPRAVGYVPRAVNGGEWKVCTPKTVAENGWGGFSAVGYFFGKRLQDELKVPIGLVEDCWGGTSAEAWTSAPGLAPLGDFAPQLATVAARSEKGGPVFGTYKNLWLDENDQGTREGWSAEGYDDSGWYATHVPVRTTGDSDRGERALWFRRTVDVPTGGAATLVLNRIDDTDTTWVNGQLIGTTSFDWAWRRYSVILKPGRNVIALRVFTDRPLPFLGKPEDIYVELVDGTRLPLAGTWKGRAGLVASMLSTKPRDAEPNPTVPTTLYNGMIAPLAPLAIKGAIWYQGETNTPRAAQYRRLLPAMIADWRRAFGQGDFPFYIVSLANFMPRDTTPGDNAWAELRDAQAYAASTVPNAGLVTTIDVGEAEDIHPKEKWTVGDRLATLALAKAYGHKIEASGPTYRSMKREGAAVRVTFDHAQLMKARVRTASQKGTLRGFAVAGKDRRWHWADAKIEGANVVVSSTEVPHPVAVRYAWGHNPAANLYNGADLPAVPFRTDDWPLVTRDNK